MALLLLVILALLFFGSLPTFPHSREWGYRPAGLLGVLLVVVVVLALFGSIPWGYRSTYVVAPRPVVIDRRPITVINPPATPAKPANPPVVETPPP